MTRSLTRDSRRDRGLALPLVLVITVALGGVVLAVASYATASLRFGQVAEDRSDRLAAADAGMRYALDQIKLRARGCVWDTAVHTLPGITTDFNEATASVECQRISSGLEDIQLYSAVMTGEGVPLTGPDDYLLKAQGGSLPKVLGGPVYMERIDAGAFDFDSSSTSAGVNIEAGPLLYPDPTPNCTSVAPSVVVARANNNLRFVPDLVYGPECISQDWKQKFKSPTIPVDLSALPQRDGTIAIGPAVALATVTPAFLTTLLTTPTAVPNASYLDVTGSGGCRIFLPGRYTASPATANKDAYLLSGDYAFDLPTAGATILARQGVVTAGKQNTFIGSINERPNTTACREIQDRDPIPTGEGATFYLGGKSHIKIETNGALEIHGRKQGNTFVSVQTLCKKQGDGGDPWCRNAGTPTGNVGGDGGLGPPKVSTLSATLAPQVLFTNSGNGKEFIAHGLFYAPTARAEFGNVSNTAVQKMLGGIVVAQLWLQAATSATNFEIAVPTSPITGKVEVTSTATKNGQTSIKAIIEYRPYESNVDDRIKVNSWRVCEDARCS